MVNSEDEKRKAGSEEKTTSEIDLRSIFPALKPHEQNFQQAI